MTEAKKKECPLHLMTMSLSVIIAKVGSDIDLSKIEELMSNSYCTTSDCALWVPEEDGVIVNDIGENELSTTPAHCGLIK